MKEISVDKVKEIFYSLDNDKQRIVEFLHAFILKCPLIRSYEIQEIQRMYENPKHAEQVQISMYIEDQQGTQYTHIESIVNSILFSFSEIVYYDNYEETWILSRFNKVLQAVNNLCNIHRNKIESAKRDFALYGNGTPVDFNSILPT